MRRSSGDCLPRLATHSLAGAAGEVVDSSSLPRLCWRRRRSKWRKRRSGVESRSG